MIRRKMKGEAAVAGAVLVAALEAMPGIAQQQSPRGQQRDALRRTVPERALGDRRDAYGFVPFLERRILRTGRADNIADTPARA
jgi:hypothetical protein